MVWKPQVWRINITESKQAPFFHPWVSCILHLSIRAQDQKAKSGHYIGYLYSYSTTIIFVITLTVGGVKLLSQARCILSI